MYAEVIINSNAKALDKVFDYKIPDDMLDKIHIGSRVFVPFGRGSKLEDGFVISLKENSEYECKEIGKIEIENSLSENKIELAMLVTVGFATEEELEDVDGNRIAGDICFDNGGINFRFC